MLTQVAASLALLLALVTGQATGVLRVRVVLTDASGVAAPVPRLVILVSDDPPSDEPRRLRTAADGSVELKLAPGRYVVELDEPIAFRGQAYTWTQTVEVAAGRDTRLDLTVGNAEAATGARLSADSTTLLTAWRDSVVEIWTPTRHASGFVIDSANGLIAASHHAIGNATTVEVQFTLHTERFKIPGRVLSSQRDPGAAVIWVDPQALTSTRALDLGCARGSWPAVGFKDVLSTITASMLGNKEISDGMVLRTTSQAIFSDIRIGDDSEGGPVFAESGALLGISAIDDDTEDRRRWNDAWVVPAERACAAVASALTKTAGATPPPGTRLPMEPIVPAIRSIITPGQRDKPAAASQAAATTKSSDFDITVLTSAQVRGQATGLFGIRADFGSWTEYVRDVDQVLLVRISPQFEESMWKMLARAAASTQGVSLPPLRSFTSNFLQLRAYCGDVEVTPIHPFIIEHEIPDRSPIREGLYVFDRGAFGPHCQAIRFSMFSERDPKAADTKIIDPKLFEP